MKGLKDSVNQLSASCPEAKMVSLLIHAMILLSVLAVVFFYLVSQLERQAFKDQIDHLVSDKIPALLAEKDSDGRLRGILGDIPLDTLSALYDKPSQTTTLYNNSLINYLIGINMFIVILIVGSSLLLYFSCGKAIPLSWIVVENVILFSFVGAFEYYFFQTIASKYIPVKPSALTTRLYADLQKLLV